MASHRTIAHAYKAAHIFSHSDKILAEIVFDFDSFLHQLSYRIVAVVLHRHQLDKKNRERERER